MRDRKIPWFTSKSRVGYCCYCQRWLGNSSKTQKNADLAQCIWIANILGELIAGSEKFAQGNSKDNISQAIRAIVNLTQKGNVAGFARAFNLPKNTVWMWHEGKSIPSLSIF